MYCTYAALFFHLVIVFQFVFIFLCEIEVISSQHMLSEVFFVKIPIDRLADG